MDGDLCVDMCGRLESSMYTRQYLEAQLAVALGGRLAEELVFGEDQVTTGASNDMQQVSNIAKRMVTQFGMSDRIGLMGINDGGPMFMGRRMAEGVTEWSEELRKVRGYSFDRRRCRGLWS
jgi:cell division protease FtsH